MTSERILKELNIIEEVLNIYRYGSVVYGTIDEDSDQDFIIVTKSAFLQSGGFKSNAISSEDRKIQGVLYSRTGFIDAINNYDMAALECLFLPEEHVIQKKWHFKLQKFDEKEFVKKIISKISNSWYIAGNQSKDGYFILAKKGIFHALRILHFALQIKEHGEIVNYQECNDLKKYIDNEEDFHTKNYIELRDTLMDELREEKYNVKVNA